MSDSQTQRHAHNWQDLTGKKFGRLTILNYAGKIGKRTLWRCECVCGHVSTIQRDGVMRAIKSGCTCRNREILPEIKNGFARRRASNSEYTTWCGMKSRVLNPKHMLFHKYGGRGIAIDPRWMDFANFLSDMGMKPNKSLTLERKDNDGNYEPSNCIWATRKEQARNTSKNRIISFNGQSKTMAEWSEETGISPPTLYVRIKQLGWTLEKALTTPVRNHREY